MRIMVRFICNTELTFLIFEKDLLCQLKLCVTKTTNNNNDSDDKTNKCNTVVYLHVCSYIYTCISLFSHRSLAVSLTQRQTKKIKK